MSTIEGAMVLTSLAVTAGMLLAGFSTVAQHSAAGSLARDAARMEAIGGSGSGLVTAREPEASVDIRRFSVGGQDAVEVTVGMPSVLFDVTNTATVVAEPTDSGSE